MTGITGQSSPGSPPWSITRCSRPSLFPLAGTGAPPVSLQAIGPLGSETSLIDFGRTLEESGLVGFIPAPMATGNT